MRNGILPEEKSLKHEMLTHGNRTTQFLHLVKVTCSFLPSPLSWIISIIYPRDIYHCSQGFWKCAM